MLEKRWLYLLLCLLAALPVLPTLAQDVTLTQQVQLGERFSILLPASWTVEEIDAPGSLVFEGNAARARAITPDELERLSEIDVKAPMGDVLVSVYRDFAAERARASSIEMLMLGDHAAASYRFTNGDAEGLFIVIEFGAGRYGLFEFIAPAGQLDGLLDLANAIAASFSENEDATDPKPELPLNTSTEDAGSTILSSALDAASAASCTVSAEVEGTASLHVGPGYNRAIVTFLPPGQVFTVTGSYLVEESGEWFQLDKSEIPAAAVANEVWVPRELVQTQGNCDAVSETDAPPVIPNRNIPPLQTTDDPGVPVPATPAPVEGGIVPLDGTWTMTFAPTTPVSCLNTETVHIDSAQLWNTEPFASRMTVAPDGSSFAYGADTFIQLAPNVYGGSFTFDSNSNAQVRFDMISPSQMVAQVVYNETVNGTPCSATGTLYVSRN